MFIRVKEGLKLRDPLTKLMIPPEGAHVVESFFWDRRIAEGSAEVVAEPIESVDVVSKGNE